MIKREARFTILFRHYLKAHPMGCAAFELKQTQTNSIPFSDVKEHQIDALMAVKRKGLLYKISDTSYDKKPFDMFFLKGDAWVVIRYPSCFVIISAWTWDWESKRSERRSLTSERAREIAYKTIELA